MIAAVSTADPSSTRERSITLRELLAGIASIRLERGSLDRTITDVALDSRAAGAGSLFIAHRGSAQDGHDFIADACRRGAVAVLIERPAPVPDGVTVLAGDGIMAALPLIARRLFRDPSSRLSIVGITGTNGKTTTTFLLRSILEAAGRRTGIVGTVGYFIGDRVLDAPNTTPDALLLNRVLAECLDAGLSHIAMEVSSHALKLDRVEGLTIAAAVFTNLTQDHLDFHPDMNDYFESKARLFEMTHGAGAVNIDDESGRELGRRHPRAITYGDAGRVAARNVRSTLRATSFDLVVDDQSSAVTVKLVGRPHVANCLAAAAGALAIGIAPDAIRRGLESAVSPPGRFELVESDRDFAIAVDYAHTPDALERLLQTGRELKPARLLTVFGCGGDRDRKKRPLMGRIASDLADEIWVTSDNPRTEDPEAIIDEVMAGASRRVHRVTDRRAAIHEAVAAMRSGDLLLIAGKGHEDYQIVGRTKHPFDDRNVAREALKGHRT